MNSITNNPGFLTSLYETGKSSANWLSTNAKSLSANAGDVLNKVCSAVSEFFSTVAQTLGTWMNSAKDGLFAAKDQFVALPKESKIAGGITLAVATLAAFVVGKCWKSEAAVPAAPSTAVVLEQGEQPAVV